MRARHLPAALRGDPPRACVPARRGAVRVRRLPTAMLCLLAALLFAGCAARAQSIHLPPVSRMRLANGARLVIMEYHRAPTVTVNMIFRGGERLDPAGKEGAVSIMAELLKRGTETRSAPQIAEAIDTLGGSLDTGSDAERCTAGLYVLAKDLDAGLDLMADVLRHPTFAIEELERERSLEVASLEAIGEDPARVASYLVSQTAYAGHPYGREATLTSTRAITRNDIVSAYKSALSPDRAIIVAVGDFKTAEMVTKLKARFGDWQPSGLSVSATPPVRPGTVRRILIDKPDATQTQVRLVRSGFPRVSPDYLPAELASAILGGGFTSRLVEEVRVNKSLTYGIGSSFPSAVAGGLFEVSTFTKIETTRGLLDTTNGVLAKTARSGVTAAEYNKARGYLTGQYAMRVETPEAIAGELGAMAFYGLPDDYLATYLDRLRAVPVSSVNRIAAKYFDPRGLSTILVGPAVRITPQLKGEGEFEVRPVAGVGK